MGGRRGGEGRGRKKAGVIPVEDRSVEAANRRHRGVAVEGIQVPARPAIEQGLRTSSAACAHVLTVRVVVCSGIATVADLVRVGLVRLHSVRSAGGRLQILLSHISERERETGGGTGYAEIHPQ